MVLTERNDDGLVESKRNLEEFLELQSLSIDSLFHRLRVVNMMITKSLESDNYENFYRYLRRGKWISNAISGRTLWEREEFFFANAKLFCKNFELGKLTEAKEILNDLVYYQHCFLQDGRFQRIPFYNKKYSKTTKEYYFRIYKMLEDLFPNV